MRSLLLLCALAVCLMLVCKPSERIVISESVPMLAPVEATLESETLEPAAQPSLFSLLTLSVAVVGALSSAAADSPIDANAQLAARIADTTAELEASAARVADARAVTRLDPGSTATR